MKLLAIDCSTDRMSLALADGDLRWQHEGAGGAQASAALIPAIMGLLDEINQTGTTVVMATHDHRVVNAMRRRVIQLDRGVIVRDQERGVYE